MAKFWANFIRYWANFNCCNWPNIEQTSSHLVTLSVNIRKTTANFLLQVLAFKMTDQSDQSKCDKPWNHFFQGQSFILFMLPLSFLFLPYIYHSYAHHLSLKYLPFLTLPSLTLSFYLGNRNNLFFLVLCIGMFFFS